LIWAVFKFASQPKAHAQEVPNILLIMTGQQTWDAVGYSGNEHIKTPSLYRLASEGVNFSQGKINSSVK